MTFFAFLCAADFVELERAFLKRFLMADFPWCTLAFFKELCGALLGELLEAFFLLLCATFFPLRGFALFFVLGLAVGHLLHLTRGAVLRLALVLELVGTHLDIRSLIIQFRTGKFITITCSLVVVHCGDTTSCHSRRQDCFTMGEYPDQAGIAIKARHMNFMLIKYVR